MLQSALPALKPFASNLLNAEIRKRFALDLDVTTTYLLNMGKAAAYKATMNGDPLATSDRALKLATQSLLDCALQNFEAAEAQPSGLEAGGNPSLIIDSDKVSIVGSPAKTLPIVPEAFAAMVRDLDIGGKYQALVDATTAGNAAKEAYCRVEQSTLRLHAHLAYLRGAIDKATYDALARLATHGQASYQGQPVLCSRMTLLHATLTGAVAFGIAPPGSTTSGRFPPPTFPYAGWIVLYLPGTSDPLTAHTTRNQCEAFLLKQLPAFRSPKYLQMVPERSKSVFLSKLQDTLEPFTWNPAKGYEERMKDPDAWVSLHLQPFTQPVLDELASQRQLRLKDDAAFHAVSTAAEDEKTAAKRLAYFESVALNALNVGAFFIPGLAPLMLGLTVLQLGHEVYEGLADWADGDREQAFGYLMDVIENLALIGALGAAAGAGGKPALEKIAVETPSFIEELKPVELATGDVRLWRRDLQPFAHDIVLPAALQPDEFGLYHHQGKAWLPIEDQVYAVKTGNANTDHRLLHPTRPQGYQPQLLHNGAGAWLHELDQPREWTGMRLFRRLGHLSDEFDEQAASQILLASDTDESVLRRILSENQRLPALLEDTLQRFKLDRQVSQSLPDAGITARNAEFEKLYRQQTARDTSLIQRVYPGLPSAISDELLRNANSVERRSLTIGKVPLRIAEEIRLYQQHVRLARAREGLYLSSLRGRDSDRLILHTLQQLPGWPADLRIDLHQRMTAPGHTDSIGPADAPVRLSINSAWAGYLKAPDADTPEEAIAVHDTLYAAVFEGLAASQRAVLGATSPDALQQLARKVPMPDRGKLRQLLGMQRATFRSPMRLADGRIGYPLSGGAPLDTPTRSNLLRQINDLGLPQRLTRSAETILDHMRAHGLSAASIQARIEQLAEECRELRASLAQWRAGQGVLTDLAVREASRYEIEDAIWRHWAQGALEGVGERDSVLHLQQTFIAEFPEHLPAFLGARTTYLRLDNISLDYTADGSLRWAHFETQLRNLFQHFPNLQRLDIERPFVAHAPVSGFANSLLLITTSFPQLTQLRFINQNLPLFPLDIERLATRPLSVLDLSGNSFNHGQGFSFPDLQLDHLGLEHMAIARWPEWLNSTALERIGSLSLRDNNLTAVPQFLLDNAVHTEHHTLVSLDGNAILPLQLQNLHLSQDGQPRRFAFTLDLPAALEERLANWIDERQQLREATYEWANASTSSGHLSPQTIEARTQIGTVLLDYWENRVRGTRLATLNLTNLSLQDFPRRLPEFFYRYVERLMLSNVECSAVQLDQFLRQFPALNSLTLEGHMQPLQALPLALFDAPLLSELNLREQGLEVDRRFMADLARVQGLTVLDLSGNRISPTLQAPIELSRPLHRLYLRNMGLQQWPAWLDNIMPLRVLALDENQLTELPEHIVSNPENDEGVTSVSLANNPLSDATMRRAHLSQGRHRSFTFDMDLTPEIIGLQPPEYGSENSTPGSSPGSAGSIGSAGSAGSAGSIGSEGGAAIHHRHSPVPWREGEVPDVERWLQGNEQMQAIHRAQWQTLEQSGEARDLLILAGRLTQSAPYRIQQTRPEFIDRMWQVLEMAAGNIEVRLLFNGMAQDGGPSKTCGDGALLVFKQIEEQLLVRQMGTATPGDNHGQYLYRMTRLLFRQRELDRIARETPGNRDEAELRLSYHRHLAEILDLPAPADDMLFESVIRLNPGELEAVERQVRDAEESEAFLRFAAEFRPWMNYLREAHAEQFERIRNGYLEAEERVDQQVLDNPNLTREQLIQAALDNMFNEEQQLLRELTNRAGREWS